MARRIQSNGTRKVAEKITVVGSQTPPTVFTCPDCSGTLFLVKQGTLIRFRCRIGHSYSPESMMEAQDENVERSLWTVIRALEEQAQYLNDMAQQLSGMQDSNSKRQYTSKGRASLRSAKVIRDVITRSKNGEQRV